MIKTNYVSDSSDMKKIVETFLPSKWGDFRMIAYESGKNQMPHIAMVSGEVNQDEPVLVRIHSECLTGDLLGSARCDCGEQLDTALEAIGKKSGVLLYMRQEGRGIGIINKMKAYNLQDKGFNTAEANTELGLEVDSRDYDLAIKILKDLGVKNIRLLTNNPLKIEAFENAGVNLVSRVPIIIKPKSQNLGYLTVKQTLMGHMLDINKDSNHQK